MKTTSDKSDSLSTDRAVSQFMRDGESPATAMVCRLLSNPAYSISIVPNTIFTTHGDIECRVDEVILLGILRGIRDSVEVSRLQPRHHAKLTDALIQNPWVGDRWIGSPWVLHVASEVGEQALKTDAVVVERDAPGWDEWMRFYLGRPWLMGKSVRAAAIGAFVELSQFPPQAIGARSMELH